MMRNKMSSFLKRLYGFQTYDSCAMPHIYIELTEEEGYFTAMLALRLKAFARSAHPLRL